MIFKDMGLVDEFYTELLNIEGFYRQHVIQVLQLEIQMTHEYLQTPSTDDIRIENKPVARADLNKHLKDKQAMLRNILQRRFISSDTGTSPEVLEAKDIIAMEQNSWRIRSHDDKPQPDPVRGVRKHELKRLRKIAHDMFTGTKELDIRTLSSRMQRKYGFFLRNNKWPDIYLPRAPLKVFTYEQANGAMAGNGAGTSVDPIFKNRVMGSYVGQIALDTLKERYQLVDNIDGDEKGGHIDAYLQLKKKANINTLPSVRRHQVV